MRILNRKRQMRTCRILTARRYLSHFRVIEHTVPCSHTRYYPGTTEPGHENDLKLAVKQYLPLKTSKHESQRNDVTIIGGHANGFPKEAYEPLWDDLYEQMETRGQGIRSIWIADIAQQGQSGVMNESILSDDSNWWDHARDLMYLINQKQKEMPQPLVGIGHSMGASHLAALSLLHPRLLQSLILIDPVIQTENPSLKFAPASTYRRDLWPSWHEAASGFRKSKFYQSWDLRVLDKWLQYGLRQLPTELYPDSEAETKDSVKDNTSTHRSRECCLHDTIDEIHSPTGIAEDSTKPVTLTSTKVQELIHYLRPLYKLDNLSPPASTELKAHVYPDINPQDITPSSKFYRPEPAAIFRSLDQLLPSVQYMFGNTSPLATAELRQKKLAVTGVGIGGSGGVPQGRVKEVVLETGHMVPFEQPGQCAEHAAEWITSEVERWRRVKEEWAKAWKEKNRRERIEVDKEWMRLIPRPERKGS